MQLLAGSRLLDCVLAAAADALGDRLQVIMTDLCTIERAASGSGPRELSSTAGALKAVREAGEIHRRLIRFYYSGSEACVPSVIDLNAALTDASTLVRCIAGPGGRVGFDLDAALPLAFASAWLIECELLRFVSEHRDKRAATEVSIKTMLIGNSARGERRFIAVELSLSVRDQADNRAVLVLNVDVASLPQLAEADPATCASSDVSRAEVVRFSDLASPYTGAGQTRRSTWPEDGRREAVGET